MAYIGRNTDKISNIEILDNITFDGSSSYSITKNSVAFTPNSAQSLLISIDGVVQATNFTVSSSTIDFGVAIPSTSSCDFFLHYGIGLITTVSDGTITTAKIGDDAVTKDKLSAHNYPAFEATMSANQTVSSNDTSVKAQIDTEVFDTDNCYDNSTNYRFTPTVAGKYNVNFFSVGASASGNSDCDKVIVSLYKNGSRYRESLVNFQNNDGNSSFSGGTAVVDMNGSTDYLEVYVRIDSSGGGTGQINASDRTWFGAYRIGD